jgi:hypothetical protein
MGRFVERGDRRQAALLPEYLDAEDGPRRTDTVVFD